MRRFLAAFLLLPTSLWAQDPCAYHTPQPPPQNVGRDIVGQDLDTLVEQGHMLFALYEDFPPYSWEEGGEAQGVDVEIARLIADYVGVEPRFNFVGAGENLEADLRTNIWRGGLIGGRIANVMMRVPYDSAFACRVEQVVFTGQYATERIAIAYDAAHYDGDAPTPPFFRFETVAVENDSIADFYLSGLLRGQTANIRRFASMEEGMAALASGSVTAAMGPRAQLEHGAGDGIAVHEPPLPGFARGEWTIGVGVHFAYRPLAYTVGDAVTEALRDGRIAGIYERYGLSHGAPSW